MKKKISIVAIVLVLSLLAVCEYLSFVNDSDFKISINTRKVPESIINDYFSSDLEHEWEISEVVHDYNSDTHIDSVKVVLRKEHEYGVEEENNILKYQYYASDDIWKIVNKESSRSIQWNKEKLEKYWEGKGFCCDWWIDILNIDLEKKEMTINYCINYYSQYVSKSNEIECILSDTRITERILTFSNNTEYMVAFEGTHNGCNIKHSFYITLSLDNGIKVDL